MLNQELTGHRHHSFRAPPKCSKLPPHWVRWIIMQAIILKIVEKQVPYQQCLSQHNNNFFHFWVKRPYAETTALFLWCKEPQAQLNKEHTKIQRFKSRNHTTMERTLVGEFVISLIQSRSLVRTRWPSHRWEVSTGKIRSNLCTSKRVSQQRWTRNWDFSIQISLAFDKWEKKFRQSWNKTTVKDLIASTFLKKAVLRNLETAIFLMKFKPLESSNLVKELVDTALWWWQGELV